MAKAKIITTFEFEYDEALFEKYYLEAGGWESVEHFERITEQKIPTCEKYLAEHTKEQIIDMYYDGEYYGYSKFIIGFDYEDGDLEKI